MNSRERLVVHSDKCGSLLRRILIASLGFCALVLVALRFFALERAPPGFYLDEAAIAAQAMCVAETWRSADGSIGMFAPVLAGGYVTPVTLWLSAGWIHLFGDTPAAFRALAAVMGLMSIVAVVFGARAWQRKSGSWDMLSWGMAVLLVFTSPWLFHLSRVYWDPIFAVAMWSVALAFWCVWYQMRRPVLLFGLGVFASLAMLSYPPFRVGVPLSLLVMLLPFRGWRWADWGALVGGGFVGLLPLLDTVGDGDFWFRSNYLAVWSSYHFQRTGGSLWDVPGMVLRNFALHLDPRFWLLDGDANRRHSTGFGGLMSPAEALALVTLLVLVIRQRLRAEMRILLLILVGLLPAALTWQLPPHALRGLMAAPAVLLAAVLGVEQLRQRLPQVAPALVTALALGFFGFYANHYFTRYPAVSKDWYDVDTIARWMETHEWDQPRQVLSYQYFRMSMDGESCLAGWETPP